MLTPDMRAVIEASQLCFAATVTPEGRPNLSPRGRSAWDDREPAWSTPPILVYQPTQPLGGIARLPAKSDKVRRTKSDTVRRTKSDTVRRAVENMKNQRYTMSIILLTMLALLSSATRLRAQASVAWSEPFPPFRIAGNVYYVGSKGLASYLIITPQGHILINSDLETSTSLMRESVEQLGFKFADIKILLISHAHWDHDAGSAGIKRLTGAKYMVMDGDASVVESGGKTDFQYGSDPAMLYPPTKVDRVLHDGDLVQLGGTTLVAHLTPGHTRGCTTWTMQVAEAGKTYNVVIVGSPNVNPGYKLVKNSSYPQIAADYERTFSVLKSLPVDIFLGAHGSYFGLEAKYERMQKGDGNPFIDPAGYRAYVNEREATFRAALAQQKAAIGKGAPR